MSVTIAGFLILGVKEDGNVIIDGYELSYPFSQYIKPDTFYWTNIVDIASGNKNVVALRADGTVVSTLYAPKTKEWIGIIDVELDENLSRVIGLRADGTVLSSRDDYINDKLPEWTDIIEISIEFGDIFGLKQDGTVITTGYDKEVLSWKNIKSIASGSFHTVGLKEDGTVIATGDNDYGQCNILGWKNIKK